MLDDRKRTWAEVKISGLGYNYYAMKALLPEGCRFMRSYYKKEERG